MLKKKQKNFKKILKKIKIKTKTKKKQEIEVFDTCPICFCCTKRSKRKCNELVL